MNGDRINSTENFEEQKQSHGSFRNLMSQGNLCVYVRCFTMYTDMVLEEIYNLQPSNMQR